MIENTRTARIVIVALIVAVLALTGVVGVGTYIIASARNAPAVSGGMMAQGSTGMMGNADPSAPADQQFLTGMIAHHEMAITMVQMMISQSDRPEMRDLGQRIITGQQQQIVQMRAWLQQWYPNASASAGGSMMGGMMGQGTTGMGSGAMMRGDGADRMFLQGMIPHHQRAIDMANEALRTTQRPELKGLAQEIIAVQSAEITEMQGYLTAWYGITS